MKAKHGFLKSSEKVFRKLSFFFVQFNWMLWKKKLSKFLHFWWKFAFKLQHAARRCHLRTEYERGKNSTARTAPHRTKRTLKRLKLITITQAWMLMTSPSAGLTSSNVMLILYPKTQNFICGFKTKDLFVFFSSIFGLKTKILNGFFFLSLMTSVVLHSSQLK